MNQFQKTILDKHSDLSITDFIYFTDISMKKIETKGLPNKHCKINNIYINCNYTKYHRLEYCLLNCGLKCL